MLKRLKGKILYKIWLHINNMPDWAAHQWQLYRLRNIVKLAFGTVHFYKDLAVKNGNTNLAVDSLGDLDRLPLVKRSFIRQYPYSEMITKNIDSSFLFRANFAFRCTSDGEPFKFWFDRKFYVMWLNLLKNTGFQNINLADEKIIFVHHASSMDTMLLANNFLRLSLNYFKEDKQKLLRTISDFGPRYIFFDGLNGLDKIIDRFSLGTMFENLKLKAVFIASPDLPGEVRKKLEDILGCPIFLYAYSIINEIPNLGWECEKHSGFHLNLQSFILEIVDQEGRRLPDGEIGDMCVTYFDNELMPFLRYLTGDRGYFLSEPCSCGRRSPVFKMVPKENNPNFKVGGRIVYYEDLANIFQYYFNTVDKFEVRATGDSVRVGVFSIGKWHPDFMQYLSDALKSELGDSARLNIEIIDQCNT